MLCISESHFGIRSKCPNDFTLVGRSKKVESKSPRGGVAIFKSRSCSVDLELMSDDFQDSVICRIMNTDVLLVAMYIPPSNSVYFDEKYFANLDLISDVFKSHQLIILGDFNSLEWVLLLMTLLCIIHVTLTQL